MENYKNSRLEAEVRKSSEEIMSRAKAKSDEKFTFFWNGTFSQWVESPFEIDGVKFNTAEQYMMYKKALLFNDFNKASQIMKTKKPNEQKQFGREVKNFDKVLWESNCKKFVYDASRAKYTQNPKMLTELLATKGTTLVEASPYDKIWGIGLAKHDSRVNSRSTWLGTNWLGEILTKVREELSHG